MLVRRIVALAAVVAAVALSSCTIGPVSAPSPSPSEPIASTPSPTPPALPPAITIDAPAEDETVSVPFLVSGVADTFEATLMIDAVDASGMVACSRLLTATSGSGTPGTWAGVLAFPPEEDPLAVTLRAYARSPKDNAMIDLIEYPITIAPDRPRIFLTSPTCGQVYEPGGLVMLTGTAALFEAGLIVEVRDSFGAAVVSLPVTAEECCVESLFSSMLTIPAGTPSGWYDVVAYSLSPKDGTVENEFPVQIEIRG